MAESSAPPAAVLLTIEQVAEILQVCRATVYLMLESGRLGPRPVKLHRCTRFRRDEIWAWVEAGCPSRERWCYPRVTGGER